MIKILDCKNKNFINSLRAILDERKLRNKINTDSVVKIVKDIKKNKYKGLIKYEKKFSKNKNIKISKKKNFNFN
tara:strand:- start:308 stop:529 length:222 start_codon:yes stop_codon:yes gene_type:complete